MQLREDEWLRQVVPSHESVVQMQHTDMASSLEELGKSAHDYLLFYQNTGEIIYGPCNDATSPGCSLAVADPL